MSTPLRTITRLARLEQGFVDAAVSEIEEAHHNGRRLAYEDCVAILEAHERRVCRVFPALVEPDPMGDPSWLVMGRRLVVEVGRSMRRAVAR